MSTYRDLEGAEQETLVAALREAANFLQTENFQDLDIIQKAYNTALDKNNIIERDAQLIGYAFGQSLVESVDFLSWQMLCDPDYGDEISLGVLGRSLGCSPLSMIKNRLEDREQWDLLQLRSDTIDLLRSLGQHADSE